MSSPCAAPVLASGLVHGTAVSVQGQGILLLGPSGAGKSALALHLLALGARLIADDQVLILDACGLTPPLLSCPSGLPPLIEARGIGLVPADLGPPCPVQLVVDLSQTEPDRLPPPRQAQIAGRAVRLVLGPITPQLAPALILLARAPVGAVA